MTTIQLNEECSAIITSGGNEQKIYKENTIFLNDKQEFEIKFSNLSPNDVAVSIKLNGEKSNNLLVIKNGQKFVIDRFLDDNKKMIFNTYDVDGNDTDVLNAIKNNGTVEISFYRKIQNYQPINWFNSNTTTTVFPNYNYPTYTTNTGNVNINLSGSISTNQLYANNVSEYINLYSQSPVLETGKVEKGEKSKQEFTSTNGDFELIPFKTITYKLLHVSQKETITSQDIRIYCTDCGQRKKKQHHKFCPNCGTKY